MSEGPQDQQAEELPGAIERWTYLGQQVEGGHVWRAASDPTRELVYSKFKGAVVGGLYDVRVDRAGDRVQVFTATSTYVGVDNGDDMPDLLLRARRWERTRKRRALEKRDARTSEIDRALAPLLTLAANVHGYGNRQALVDYVTAKIFSA